jgi:hypothetical protein
VRLAPRLFTERGIPLQRPNSLNEVVGLSRHEEQPITLRNIGPRSCQVRCNDGKPRSPFPLEERCSRLIAAAAETECQRSDIEGYKFQIIDGAMKVKLGPIVDRKIAIHHDVELHIGHRADNGGECLPIAEPVADRCGAQPIRAVRSHKTGRNKPVSTP